MNADQPPALQVAGDTVLLDALANFLFGQFREIPELFRTRIAELLFRIQHFYALTAAYQATATTRRPEADALGFQQHDTESPFGQVQGG